MVASAVTIEGRHNQVVRRLARAPAQQVRPEESQKSHARARLGILRLAGMPVDIAGMKVLPAAQQAAADAVGYRTDAVDAIYGMMAAVDRSFAEIRTARIRAGPVPLGDRPLVVLTHQGAYPLEGEEARDYAIMVKLHVQLAAESRRGRREVVENSGPFIAIDQPRRLVEAITGVLNQIARVP